MKIFYEFITVNISKRIFKLVICFAKNFILDNFKGYFLNILIPQIPDFQIVV